ncbi:MAG TPA: hypothetical protein VE687_20860 [Stellaceae bacterium]|nr:hypothetical protein [Stellaceae bacterium]
MTKLDQVTEIAYPQKIARDILIGMARPINRHLVKLVGFDFPPELRRHFKRELRNWLDEIQRLRLKPTARTGSFKFYFDPLFDYPFGGIEMPNMRAVMELIASEYDDTKPTKSPEELVEWLRGFHVELARRLHEGDAVLDMIPE